MEFDDRILAAMRLANKVCRESKTGGITVPPEDMAILVKYEKVNLIKLTIPKPKKQLNIYYPSIQADEFKGLSANFWVSCIRWAMERNGIDGGPTKNSVSEYFNKPHIYNFIEPVILRDSVLGTAMVNEETELFNDLKEVYDD